MTVIYRVLDGAPRRVKAVLVLALLVAAGAFGLAANATNAQAVNYNYCTSIIPSYDNCTGSAVFLRASHALDDYGSNRVCAGAVNGSTFYGSYACSYGFAAQCYGGGLSLKPRIHNGENYAQQMHGRAFHSEQCP